MNLLIAINTLISVAQSVIKEDIKYLFKINSCKKESITIDFNEFMRKKQELDDWQSKVLDTVEKYDPQLKERVEHSFEKLNNSCDEFYLSEIVATLQTIKEKMHFEEFRSINDNQQNEINVAIQDFLWYGKNTVKLYIQDLHDMEMGINHHYSEFSYSDYKCWRNKVIDYFRNNHNFDVSVIENYFLKFESNYDRDAFSDILEYLNKALYSRPNNCSTTIDDSLNKDKKTKTELNQNKMENQKSKVFIVHGHSELLIAQTESFLRQLGLTPIILREQVNQGQTIIEKLENNTDVAYAIVLYTACDFGCTKEDKDKNDVLRPRARQNVVFEHGYLNAKLGRDRVCALVEEGVEKPGDLAGVLYVKCDENKAWMIRVAREMKAAGLDVDINKVII